MLKSSEMSLASLTFSIAPSAEIARGDNRRNVGYVYQQKAGTADAHLPDRALDVRLIRTARRILPIAANSLASIAALDLGG